MRRQAKRDAAVAATPKAAPRFACRRTPYFDHFCNSRDREILANKLLVNKRC